MRRRVQLALGLALIAMFALASPAPAAPPETTRDTFSGTAPFAECEGFDIIVNFTVTVQDTSFFDNSGALVRQQVHMRGTGELVNTVTGKTETGSSPSMTIYDYRAGTFTAVGLTTHNNVPGEGIVALEAGKIVFAGFDEFGAPIGEPIFVAGPHEEVDWCSILA
jgi:hypothetical protein